MSVAVWWAACGERPAATDLALLDEAEARRAAEIRHPGVRARFVAGRATLRRLLAARAGLAPTAVRVDAARDRRPRVVRPEGWTASIAHTRDLVVVTAGRDVDLGVDVERLDRRPPPPARWCAPSERDAAEALDAVARRTLLLHLWTAKEAVGKADGHGLARNLRRLEIPAALDGPVPRAGPARGPGVSGITVRWVDVGPEHVVALATRSRARPDPAVGADGPQNHRRPGPRTRVTRGA